MTNDAPRASGLHPLIPLAVGVHQAGRLDEAREIYQRILSADPNQFDAVHMMGVISLQQERYEEAQAQIMAALKIQPDNTPALINLTAAYLRARKLDEALAWARRAVECDPESVDALVNLGSILHEMGDFHTGIAPLQTARQYAPNSALVCNLLGSCLIKAGDATEAAEVFEAAVRASPSDADSWANLSVALNATGDSGRALECAQKSIDLRGDSANALAAKGASLLELGKLDEAIAIYREAMKHSPKLQDVCALANALITAGLNDEALEYLRRAIEMDPTNPTARWISGISTLKPIYATESEIQSTRQAFRAALDELHDWYLKTSNPLAFTAVGASQPFYLAYQEQNNRELLSHFGDLCISWMGSLKHLPQPERKPIARTDKMRIGIASTHIRDHSVWIAITKGWVNHIDRTKFEVFIFHLSPITDKEVLAAKQAADFFDGTIKNVDGWADSIQKANLDLLIYPGIGMDALTYQLAALRLAPLQATSWGHPETSGLSTIDFYFSGDAIEPPDAQQNYSEKLVRLPNFGVYVEPLEPKVRNPNLKGLGLPTNEPLLLCPGTPFKYSPTHDWVWVEIGKGLLAKGKGRLILFVSARGTMYTSMVARMRKSFEQAGVDIDSVVCVVPTLERPRFFGLMQEGTLLLDSLGFSGFNTALQGLECGLPVLAYEGKFMRGRLASGIMRTMGMHELVATSLEEFAHKAVEIASDPRTLKKLRSQIPKLRNQLFRDKAPIRALEQFLEAEILKSRARQGGVSAA